MLTRHVKRTMARFAKNKSNQPSPIRNRIMKRQQFTNLSKKYVMPVMFEHRDDVRLSYLYGRQSTIAACTTNTIESSQFVLQAIKHGDPDLLVLGGMNNNELDRYLNQKVNIINNSNNLFCKNEFGEFLSNVERRSNKFYYMEEENMLYLVDHRNQCVESHDYLTGGIYTLMMETCQLMYGRPNSVLVAEDIILNFSLQELEAMFYETINLVKTNYRDEIMYKPKFIQLWLSEFSRERWRLSLHRNEITYITAVFKKAARNSRKCLMLLDKNWIDQVSSGCVREERDPDTLYRGYLRDESHFLKQKYVQTLKELDAMEILKRIALISVLVTPDLENLIRDKIQFFSQTVFSSLFKDLSPETILKMYEEASEDYQYDIVSIQNKFIVNNLKFSAPRLPMNLWPEEQYAAINESHKQTYPLSFAANSLVIDSQNNQNKKLLHDHMLNILRLEKRTRELDLIKGYLGGIYTKENIIFYTKFIGEVMVKTGIHYKLPVHHFGKFRGYYKRLINDEILRAEHGIKKKEPTRAALEELYEEERNEQEAEYIMKLSQRKDFNPTELFSEIEERGGNIMTLQQDSNVLPLDLQNIGGGKPKESPQISEKKMASGRKTAKRQQRN